MKTVLTMALSALIGVVASQAGVTFQTWEFWVILIAANAMQWVGVIE